MPSKSERADAIGATSSHPFVAGSYLREGVEDVECVESCRAVEM